MEEIRHRGRIIEITPQTTSVEIISESACSSCHAKSLCGMGETEAKVIMVPTAAWIERKVGDEVEVALKATMGHKAVWLAYVIPLIIMVAGLFGGLAIPSLGELGAGLLAIGLVAVYYICLSLLKGRLQNEYIFYIK